MVAGAKKAKQSGATPESGTEHGSGLLHAQHHAFPIKVRFFEELKRRNLFRVAILYLIACWVILEPTHVVFHMLLVPEWANRLVIMLMVVGFPLVLLFSWIYEITPEGLKPTAEVNPAQSIAHKTRQKLNHAIIVVLSLALVYFVADKFWLSKHLSGSEQQQASSKEGAGSATATSSEGAPKAVPVNDKSIAVLPFVDMSEKHDQEYFSDGLSEELIDRLSHSPDLKVIARTSSFAFKGKNEDIRSIASKLGVGQVLEGSVRKSGNALRITVQLIHAADGTHLWSQTYERNLSDIFKVQDEIAGTVARALSAALAENGGSHKNQEANTEAYNLLLQGNFFLDRFTKTDIDRSIEFFKKAIDADPNYAVAWSRLAIAYREQVFHGWISSADGVVAARGAAQRALQIDPNLPSPHVVLGDMLALSWNWAEATAEFQRAVELDPHDSSPARATLLFVSGLIQGRTDEVIDYLRKEVVRNPLDTASYLDLEGALFNAGQTEESVAVSRKLLEVNPVIAGGQADLAAALLFLGRFSEALDAVTKEPDEMRRLFVSSSVYWALGRRADSDAALLQLKEKYAPASSWAIANVCAYRGENDAAFEWLDRAYRQHEGFVTWVKVTPWLRSLHKDPRYRAFLLKMKMPA